VAPPLEGTAEDDRFSEYRVGLDHLAFAVEDRAELDSLVERLQAAGVDTKGVETDVVLGGEYVAFRNPDNVQLEPTWCRRDSRFTTHCRTARSIPERRQEERPRRRRSTVLMGALVPIVALTRGFPLAPFGWSGTRRLFS
jgi:catechol 2,3-dioxygenase-like lactoylglutathione lyase family enzyme